MLVVVIVTTTAGAMLVRVLMVMMSMCSGKHELFRLLRRVLAYKDGFAPLVRITGVEAHHGLPIRLHGHLVLTVFAPVDSDLIAFHGPVAVCGV